MKDLIKYWMTCCVNEPGCIVLSVIVMCLICGTMMGITQMICEAVTK